MTAGPSQTRLRPFRTTAFKLSAIYLGVFTIFAAFLIGYIARNTSAILRDQMSRAVESELKGMADQYSRGGIARLARFIGIRSRQPGASLYLVTDGAGEKIAGNVESVPAHVLNQSDSGTQIVPYLRLDQDEARSRYSALVRVVALPDGFRVLVGRDISESEDLAGVVRRSLILTVMLMVVLGLISWIFVSRRVLNASIRLLRPVGGSLPATCPAGLR
jgi:hypothetical protein